MYKLHISTTDIQHARNFQVVKLHESFHLQNFKQKTLQMCARVAYMYQSPRNELYIVHE